MMWRLKTFGEICSAGGGTEKAIAKSRRKMLQLRNDDYFVERFGIGSTEGAVELGGCQRRDSRSIIAIDGEIRIGQKV